MKALLALLLCAPGYAANRGVTLPGAVPGVSLPGAPLTGLAVPSLPGAAVPSALPNAALPSVPALPSAAVPQGPAAAPQAPAALAAASGPRAQGVQASAAKRAAAPTAKAQLSDLSDKLGGEDGPSAAPLKAAFDGSFEKGSIEARLVAPAPGKDGRVDLSKLDPSYTGGMKQKKALKKLAKDQVKLDELQQVLYADHKRKVLVVLQAMDTGGKDGTIRHVMRSLNPQGVTVASFKKPTEQERKHHWLWRIKKALGGPGMITIFNRSHYEDILAPTVYELFPKEEIESRYDTINKFEKKLTDEGWTVLKIFLYISKDEQKRRLQARLDEPDKNWKFSPEDLKSRALWPKFQSVYEEILGRTNTSYAPWFVIPADNKWYRDYAVGKLLKRALKRLDLKYPDPAPNLPKTIPD